MAKPSVSVILAVLDEAGHIGEVLEDLGRQEYPGAIQWIVADGGSVDGTREILAACDDRRLTVIGNPRRVQSHGLNAAADIAHGEILVRADGHVRLAPDYVRRSVDALLDSGAVAVGGPMNPIGDGTFSDAVAQAMNSPMVLPARFHHAVSRQQVDTVYLGCFRTADFRAIGGFRTFPSGTSEDADLYARWRARGRFVVVDPSIRTEYLPRSSVRSLARQYFRYGMGKAEMLWVNGRFPSPRPFAPALLILGTAASAVLAAVTGTWWPLAGIVGAWLAWLAVVGLRSRRRRWLVAFVAGTMHASYGVGLLWGTLRGPRPVRRSLDG
jgi:glycosyltransferase involved in cell wall biosynthesis